MSLADAHPLMVLGCLTVIVGGAAIAFAPPEKRGGFLFHLVMVTGLAAYVLWMNDR